ncbi:DUF6011 domain-containing protein [Nonomuraea sp. NPDC052116]|uniref:DUF6011 domain-containing protein n=1 Tax=Nonomuraea sp. NPDC052116 TaxID=3155665 RepID=UPI003417267D
MLCLGGCGRHLTAPESRRRGFGPECAEKLGIIPPSSPRFRRRDGGDCDGQGDLLAEQETPGR